MSHDLHDPVRSFLSNCYFNCLFLDPYTYRLQTLNEAMVADEGSRAKEAFSEAVGIINIYKQNSFLQDLSWCVFYMQSLFQFIAN